MSEILEEIEAFASGFTAIKTVQLIVGVSAEQWTDQHQTAYDKGWARSEETFWQKVYETALNGSAPAQAMIAERIKNQKLKNTT